MDKITWGVQEVRKMVKSQTNSGTCRLGFLLGSLVTATDIQFIRKHWHVTKKIPSLFIKQFFSPLEVKRLGVNWPTIIRRHGLFHIFWEWWETRSYPIGAVAPTTACNDSKDKIIRRSGPSSLTLVKLQRLLASFLISRKKLEAGNENWMCIFY